MKLAIDAMGGDSAPASVVQGSVQAVNKFDVHLILVGKEQEIKRELAKHKYPKDSISIYQASEVITMDESPVAAVKQKKDSSINVALELVKNGSAQGVISAGNTGAYMAAALFKLGRIKGVERPAIATMFPTPNGKTVVLDMGANVDCKPKHLVQFAVMGSILAQHIFDLKTPRVGLLNIGKEEEKGNELTTSTYKLLRELNNIHFIGNIEGQDVLSGKTDVVVCDGFVGNMLLKFGEGIGFLLTKVIKEEIKQSFTAKIGALFMYPSLKHVRKMVDYDEYGGALLVGLDGVCIKAHGRANGKAFCNAIKQAINAVDHKVVDYIKNNIE